LIQKQFRYCNIVKCYGLFINYDYKYIVLELCSYSLEDLLESRGHLTYPEIRINSIHILGGIKHIHQCRLIHCDINPRNILFGKDGNLKISDFGLTIDFQTSHDEYRVRGSKRYMAPEFLKPGKEYKQRIDIWSVGISI